jgi:hypothetical protein
MEANVIPAMRPSWFLVGFMVEYSSLWTRAASDFAQGAARGLEPPRNLSRRGAWRAAEAPVSTIGHGSTHSRFVSTT